MQNELDPMIMAVAVAVRDQCAAQWCERSSQVADVNLVDIIEETIDKELQPPKPLPGFERFDPSGDTTIQEYMVEQAKWCILALQFAKCNTSLHGAFRDIDKAIAELILLDDAIHHLTPEDTNATT